MVRYPIFLEFSTTPGAYEAELAKAFYLQYYESPGHYENMTSNRHTGFAVSVQLGAEGRWGYIPTYNAMIFSVAR